MLLKKNFQCYYNYIKVVKIINKLTGDSGYSCRTHQRTGPPDQPDCNWTFKVYGQLECHGHYRLVSGFIIIEKHVIELN